MKLVENIVETWLVSESCASCLPWDFESCKAVGCWRILASLPYPNLVRVKQKTQILSQPMQASPCHSCDSQPCKGDVQCTRCSAVKPSPSSCQADSCKDLWYYFCFSNCTKLVLMSSCQEYWKKSSSPQQYNRLQSVVNTWQNLDMLLSLGLFEIPVLNTCTWPFHMWMAYLQSVI